jgi:bifunctional DNA-binding transcriptional regulator/antitoxin component of YhaV-PrlF toxin-antitoxin module
LQTTKISVNGRVTLGQTVLDRLNAGVGDFVQFFENDSGRVHLAKVSPPGTEDGDV